MINKTEDSYHNTGMGAMITVYTLLRIDMLLTALTVIATWFIPGLIMEKEYHLYKRDKSY